MRQNRGVERSGKLQARRSAQHAQARLSNPTTNRTMMAPIAALMTSAT
jgi:hypothetical protein